MSYDLLFRNARVLDGTGSPWFSADVAIAEGRIAAVGRGLAGDAVREIDVGGQILAPGFYDMHSHSDIALLVEPRHEPKVFQGVTFELLGQDGLSFAPVTPEIREQIRRHLAGLNGDDARAGWDWTSVGSFLDRFEQKTAVNVGYLVPHNAVRIGAMGWAARTATAAEIDTMRALVREGMEDGAFGLSTGLTYPPNLWSDTDEMVAMCEVVARYGGIYVTHMRGHGDAILDPIRESIEICQGPDEELARLDSPDARARVRDDWAVKPPAWDKLTVAAVRNDANRWMEGKTLGVLIAESGKEAADFVCDLLLEENLAVSHVSAAEPSESDLTMLLSHPYQMAGSDGIHLGSHVHPRTYGTYARVLQRYVREQGTIRLEEAIRKFSSFPARRLSIPDRGEIRPGLWADLVVFDEQAVTERATFEAPKQLATGFSYVAVNGTLVLDGSTHTGATPGRALRLRR